MNADGSNPKKIGKGGSFGLTWSPDGKQLAFADNRNGNYEIYVINVDGTGERQLTTNSAYDVHPTWSPDGKQILFQTNQDNPNKNPWGNWHLYVMDVNGSNQHDLTPDKEDCHVRTWSPNAQTISFHVSFPLEESGFYMMDRDGSNKRRIYTEHDADTVWSPDGKYLAAWHLGQKNGKPASDLVIMRSDGSGRVVVTNFDKDYRLLSWGK